MHTQKWYSRRCGVAKFTAILVIVPTMISQSPERFQLGFVFLRQTLEIQGLAVCIT